MLVPDEIKQGDEIVVNIEPCIPGKVKGPEGQEAIVFHYNQIQGKFLREDADKIVLMHAAGLGAVPSRDVRFVLRPQQQLIQTVPPGARLATAPR